MKVHELFEEKNTVDDLLKKFKNELDVEFSQYEVSFTRDRELGLVSADVQYDNKQTGNGFLVCLVPESRYMSGGELINPDGTRWFVHYFVSVQHGWNGFDAINRSETFDEATKVFKSKVDELAKKYK